jgi:hypothetical protein
MFIIVTAGITSLVGGSIVGAEVTVGAEVKVGASVAVPDKQPALIKTKINVKKVKMLTENLMLIKFKVFCLK